MKLDISELVLMASGACRKIKELSANASSTDLEAIKTQNEILKLTYQNINDWIKRKV
jgi:hypothetical protein